MIINAAGGVHNATCERCGASLTYVYYIDNKPYGGDCFAILMGFKPEHVSKYIDSNGVFDRARYEADKEARAAEMKRNLAEFELRKEEVRAKNLWLIEALTPHANGDNFAASIINSLSSGELATALPRKAKAIITDILSREAGRRNSKAYNTRYDEISNLLEEEDH